MSMTEFVKYEQEILRLKDEVGDLTRLSDKQSQQYHSMREANTKLEQELELQKVGCAAFKKFADDLEQENKKLEQMRSLDQNAIEAKDHKIVLLEQANAKLQAEIDSLKLQQLVKPQTEEKNG
jgi:hypothetical protein